MVRGFKRVFFSSVNFVCFERLDDYSLPIIEMTFLKGTSRNGRLRTCWYRGLVLNRDSGGDVTETLGPWSVKFRDIVLDRYHMANHRVGV